MKILAIIALLIATSVGAVENGKAANSPELLNKVKELSALQNTYNSKYDAALYFAGLLDATEKKTATNALDVVNNSIPHRPAQEYLTCNTTVDCNVRNTELDEAVTAYRNGLFRLRDKKEVFNSLKSPAMSDGFTNSYGVYVETDSGTNNDDIF